MSDVADVLERAAALLEPEGAWTQAAYARGKSGRIVNPQSKAAVCFCMAGAVERAKGDDETLDERRFIRMAIKRQYIPGWNDAPGRTQTEVVAALREASKLARDNPDA